MHGVRGFLIGGLLLAFSCGPRGEAFAQLPDRPATTAPAPAPAPGPRIGPGPPARLPATPPASSPPTRGPAPAPGPPSPPVTAPANPGIAPPSVPVDYASATPAPGAANAFAGLAGERSGGYGDIGSLPPMLNMIGDQGPSPFLARFRAQPSAAQFPSPFPPPTLPTAPGPAPAPRRAFVSAVVPSVRSFKISENQSPQPQDRVYYSFNFFANVNGDLNRRLGSPIDDFRVYREIFGFEKTFNEGLGSVGLRVPLNTVSADSATIGRLARPVGTSTSLGDLTVFGKHILALDPATGSLISAGLAVTPPTGPGAFAGAPYLQSFHSTTIQPFVGYIWRRGKFFLHGFSALDIPTTSHDSTMLYNDLGVGYELFRNPDPDAFLTAWVPTFEVHVNDPLNHRDYLNARDPIASPDVVNLTYGLNLIVRTNSTLTFGFVTPVTGPRPFDYEALLLLNVRFGRSRGSRTPPPLLGG